jgi:2-methylcitrate dehydratase PrpD
LTLADGTTLSAGADFPRGNPENPVGQEVLEAKFRALVAPGYGEPLAERALAAVRGIERCGDVRELLVGVLAR